MPTARPLISPSLAHPAGNHCRSAARNGGATIKVLPTIDELPPIEVPLVQLPKMSRTPWASFAMYDEPAPETRAEMRRLEALWGTSLWQMPAAVPLSSVLLPEARQAQDDDSRSEAGSTTSYFTNRWLPAGIALHEHSEKSQF